MTALIGYAELLFLYEFATIVCNVHMLNDINYITPFTVECINTVIKDV